MIRKTQIELIHFEGALRLTQIMNNTVSIAPFSSAETEALHERFQAIHSLLTGWDGFRRKTALESKRLGIRNACRLHERELLDEAARGSLYKAYSFIMDKLNDLLEDVEALAEDVKIVGQYGRKECLEILQRFAGYEQAVRSTYAQVLKLEAKYGFSLRKNREYRRP